MPLGRCDVDWHVSRGIVAVACVGRDMIRVWPLPVEQPWWEETPDVPGGELTFRAQDELCLNAQTRGMKTATVGIYWSWSHSSSDVSTSGVSSLVGGPGHSYVSYAIGSVPEGE